LVQQEVAPFDLPSAQVLPQKQTRSQLNVRIGTSHCRDIVIFEIFKVADFMTSCVLASGSALCEDHLDTTLRFSYVKISTDSDKKYRDGSILKMQTDGQNDKPTHSKVNQNNTITCYLYDLIATRGLH